MHNSTLSLLVLIAALVPIWHAAPACAGAPSKLWVADFGVDNASCGAVTSPCATFQQAHDNVAAGGEVGVLTPGDYGGGASSGLTIAKSIHVTNDGTGEAGILAGAGGTGIFVNAGKGDVVSPPGLVIDGQGIGRFGVSVEQVSAAHIQRCVIRNFEGSGNAYGVVFTPTGNSQLFVSDTIIFNNGSGAFSAGILIQPFSVGGAHVVLDRVHVENNVIGIEAMGLFNGSYIVIRDSVVSGNAGDGILASSAFGDPAFIVVERTSSVDNGGNGILADGQRAAVLIGDDTVARNATGISAVNSGQLISYGDNHVNNNLGADGTPTGHYSPI